MKISIIIPVYNAGPFLSEAIKSINDNKTNDHSFEIILIDDKSTDETTLMLIRSLENDPDIRVIRQSINGGPAKARNAGIRAATGDWIGFLDADDLMAPGTMRNRIDVIKQVPGARWILGDILEMRRKNELSHENHFAAIKNHGTEVAPDVYRLVRPTREMLNWSILPVLGAMLIHRDVFKNTGLLGEKLTYGEDIHFCLVLSRHADLYWMTHACLYLRRHHESMTKDVFRGAQSMPKASLLLLKDKQFRQFRKQLRWQHAANLRTLSKSYIFHGNKFGAIVSAAAAIRWVPNDRRNFEAFKDSLLSPISFRS